MPQTDADSAPLAAIVLAAGASRRLGQPKQLLRINGGTLLQHTIMAALEGGCAPVIVVLGCEADRIARELPEQLPTVHFAQNEEWAEGMGGSLACGVRALLTRAPDAAAVMILVCDQPSLSSELLRRFRAAAIQAPDKILVSAYEHDQGPPVLFPRAYFDALLALRGDTGARAIFKKNPAAVQLVPFPGGEQDVDTPADLDFPST